MIEIEYILTAVDLDPLYVDFIPMFIDAWEAILPSAKVIIILISDYIPISLVEYEKYLTLYQTPYKN